MLEQVMKIILLIILLQKNVLVTSKKYDVIELQQQLEQQQSQSEQEQTNQQQLQPQNEKLLTAQLLYVHGYQKVIPQYHQQNVVVQKSKEYNGEYKQSQRPQLPPQLQQELQLPYNDNTNDYKDNFLNLANEENYHVNDNDNAVTYANPSVSYNNIKGNGYGGFKSSDNIDDVVADTHASYQLNNVTNSVKIIRKIRNTYRNREDICNRLCNCNKINKFDLSIECHFLQHKQYILGADYFIPRAAISLNIKLSEKSKLRLDEEVFNTNKVNRILIEGNSNGNEHVEISKNAFRNNAGLYPEIDIYNCYTVVLRERAFSGHFSLNVSNSDEVIIYPQAFENTTFVGVFRNIRDLRTFSKTFSGAKDSRIDISLCHLNPLQEIDASLKELKICNSIIDKISTNTFNVNYINSLILDNNTINVIETRAVTEKLYCKYFAITNCHIDVIQREAIAGSGISDFVFERNQVRDVREYAIDFTGLNIAFSNNKINMLEYFWLTVKDWSNISIYNNTFGNYNRLNIGKTVNPVQCIHERNFITEPQPGSLELTNNFCQLKDISFYHACTCNMEWINILTTANIKLQSYCRIDDTLKFCFNTTTLNVQKYYDDVCDYSEKQVDCIKNKNMKKIEGSFIKPEEIDGNKRDNRLYFMIILYVIGSLLLITFVIILVQKYCSRRPSNDLRGCDTTTTMTTYSMKNSKSFSNEDRIIINKTLEKMKMTQSAEQYEQVYNHTKRLLDENLSETDKVITIGEIVRTLGECENTGEDFVAFTDILYRHLAPKDNNDPVYAEPTLPRPQMTELNDTVDHIYAEPSSVQQPLLTNEYAFPIDKNEKISVYAEPINHKIDNNRSLVTPYAIGSGIEVDQQQPSTSKNLPDILNQNICFQPQPEYTIPNKKLKKNRYRKDNGESSSSGSEYSGSSEITVKIDDIEYVDNKKN